MRQRERGREEAMIDPSPSSKQTIGHPILAKMDITQLSSGDLVSIDSIDSIEGAGSGESIQPTNEPPALLGASRS